MKRKFLALILTGSMVFACAAPVFAEESAEAETEETVAEETADVDETYLEMAEALQEAGVTLADIMNAGGIWSRDADESVRTYRFAVAAALLGSGDAAFKLGEQFHSYSIDQAYEVEDAVAEAMYWWEMAGENGSPRGYADIGLLYLHEAVPGGGDTFGDVEYDEDMAFYYFQLATDAGDSKGARYLAECYVNGTGVEPDEETAYYYYSLGSERGDSTATVVCADWKLEGRGTEQDIDGAIAMYQEIVDNVEHDIVECAYKLGVIYEEGVYVDQDLEKAAEYYQIVLDNAEEGADYYAEAEAALERLAE
ncbi:MAG: sel1 repeat family protein [Lachnospiraceae bacterium]|nr:sel1 repeat family protein [Lachnospiraceae bacterium]